MAKTLSPLERGDLYKEFADRNWPISKIAKKFRVNEREVRRCLDLSRAPDDVRRANEKGKLNFVCALEVAKLDPETRKAAIKKFSKNGQQVSLANIKAYAKEYNKGEDPDLQKAQNRKTGKARAAGLAAWKGKKVIESQLDKLCYSLLNTEDKNTMKWHEMRGAIGMALWQRGDLPDPIMPPNDPAESDGPGKTKKELDRINEFIEAHGLRHTPDREPADEEAE